jgi:hypothetical protein
MGCDDNENESVNKIRYVAACYDSESYQMSINYLANGNMVSIDTVESPFSVEILTKSNSAGISAGVLRKYDYKNDIDEKIIVEIYFNDILVERVTNNCYAFASYP